MHSHEILNFNISHDKTFQLTTCKFSVNVTVTKHSGFMSDYTHKLKDVTRQRVRPSVALLVSIITRLMPSHIR